ncbi:AraC family transcriptional regulator [Pseudonocardia sp. CA-107938]|uniref:AraC family transcriptional regulator n=1 Tax=Pseudonocardia sp. CA-107938 TaxID=3240021 RepID=UPI003D8C09DE
MAEVRVQRSTLDTRDPDEAHDYLRATYVDHAVQLSGSTDRFRFRHHVAGDDQFFVARYEHSMNCRVDTESFGYLLVGQMLSGRLRLSDGRSETSPTDGELFVLDPSVPMQIQWDAFRTGLVRLDLAVVNRVASEIVGAPLPGGVRFGVAKVRSLERARHWQGLVRHLTHDFLANDAAYNSPLIHAQTMRLIAATVLDIFPNTTAAADPARAGRADAGVVHRAVAYIDEHAGEPIGVTEIAAAVRVGTRTLQDAFRRHLDTTPMAYLRRTRLQRAHEQLHAAAPGEETVAAIAGRWGFAHPGRFAVLYRETYGRSPSATLES